MSADPLERILKYWSKVNIYGSNISLKNSDRIHLNTEAIHDYFRNIYRPKNVILQFVIVKYIE
jgi:hypothetical protein